MDIQLQLTWEENRYFTKWMDGELDKECQGQNGGNGWIYLWENI